MPHRLAGWRIEPPVSVPRASGASQAATAAAEPPLEPPGMRSRSHGIARRLVGAVLGRRAHGELVHVRLADQDRVGLRSRVDDVGIVRRHEVSQHLAAAGGRLAARCKARP